MESPLRVWMKLVRKMMQGLLRNTYVAFCGDCLKKLLITLDSFTYSLFSDYRLRYALDFYTGACITT